MDIELRAQIKLECLKIALETLKDAEGYSYKDLADLAQSLAKWVFKIDDF